ncbi:DUF1592 domain-containing protein [Aquisphaera giovannonii]|uniref:DUF1592 domain-containing protein n=1 Tax=Aquisphaera giovannonii TaxID=406548 RepID=UPI00143D2773|nr:DUF1592 domain-containing protein [Aquisphaera giovannonii]
MAICWILPADARGGGDESPPAVTERGVGGTFRDVVKPFLDRHCARCHDAGMMKGGIRVDRLSEDPDDSQLRVWTRARKQLVEESMPPADEPQPAEADRAKVAEWAGRTIDAALARQAERNGSVRRLTVPQYRNALRALLGLDEDLTEGLPPDALSKDGFSNNAGAMVLSPLQAEAYFDIAAKAIDLCLVDDTARPAIQNFRVDLGRKVNLRPCPDTLVLGAFSALLDNEDFAVTELTPGKPFAFTPFRMRTKYEFLEGYVGNDTIRKWRKFDGLAHAVFACVRGTTGYPKGEPFEAVPEGLLLRPAIPGPVVNGIANTYGPMANFKIAVRELPDGGNFRVTVRAARYDDGLLLEAGTPPAAGRAAAEVTPDRSGAAAVAIAEPGIYRIDAAGAAGAGKGKLVLRIDDREFSGDLPEAKPDAEAARGFLVVRLEAGVHRIKARHGEKGTLRLALRRVDEGSELGRRFAAFERRSPWLGVHLGLRRDCGSTLRRVGEAQAVPAGPARDFVFSGPINDFPSPDVEPDNVNYLAGIREIAVRSEFTDGRDMPRLLVRSVEFEGPYYSEWPPKTHRDILIDSPRRNEPEAYAGEVLRSFATRAYRRPVRDEELVVLMDVWRRAYAERKEFRASLKDALAVVLTSPQFLFVIEESSGPEAEDLTEYELASKLSFFLGNGPPDALTLDLAAAGQLRRSLDGEVERMVADPRFGLAMQEFVSQWLGLDRFDVVAIDGGRYPRLTREMKAELRNEPVRFVEHLIRHNRPIRELVDSEFLIANDAVASYYGLADRGEGGLAFAPIRHGDPHLGGILCQAAILSGLSDGREANPVKRGAWFARKVIAEPPDDPPPNVPKLPEDDGSRLTLRQKLERHRSQPGCVKCHSGIDPWGLPFEPYDAAGRFRDAPIDAGSTLPDGTGVRGLEGLKAHLLADRMDRIVFSFLKHLAGFAVGRSLTYAELESFRAEARKGVPGDRRMRDLLEFVVKSDAFLKK